MITIKIPSYPSVQKNGKIKMEPCVPSWNEILGLEHWGRQKKKLAIQRAFLSALQVSGNDLSTRTTSARNTLLTAADTLRLYETTVREKRALKLRNAKLAKPKKSTRSSKSSLSDDN